jgi:hypothetical protein
VFVDYNNSTPVNIYPQNTNPDLAPIPDPDTFFNSIINTTTSSPTNLDSSKYWQRVFCPVRGNFITIQFSFSNLQMIGVEQENFVQIDSQILYLRRAGRQLPVGV